MPEGLDKAILQSKGAYNPTMGEFLLDYSTVQQTADPAGTVLQFLEETYSAAADVAGWDRANLDRSIDIVGSR